MVRTTALAVLCSGMFKRYYGAAQSVHIGAQYELCRKFTAEDVQQFLSLTGDPNPIHSCNKAAQEKGLPGAILPGLLCASIFPAIIAQQFPGAVYISQTLKFRRPVQVGCAIRGSVRVERHLHGQTKFQTICWSSEEIVIEGTAFAILAG